MDMSSNGKGKAGHPLSVLLDLDDHDLVTILAQCLQKQSQRAWMMELIAYKLVDSYFEIYKEKYGFFLTYKDFILYLLKSLENVPGPNYDINQRRLVWFVLGSYVKMAEEKALGFPRLESSIADIWLLFAKGSLKMPTILQDDETWSDQEKYMFKEIKSNGAWENFGAYITLSGFAPHFIRRNQKVLGYLEYCRDKLGVLD